MIKGGKQALRSPELKQLGDTEKEKLLGLKDLLLCVNSNVIRSSNRARESPNFHWITNIIPQSFGYKLRHCGPV